MHKFITSQEIILIHDVIAEKFNIPKGHIKIGELETIIDQLKYIPFLHKNYDIYESASILFEGLIRFHIFVDGNKRTALESVRYFLHKNEYTFVVPLSFVNFIYNIAMNITQNNKSVIYNWFKVFAPKNNDYFTIIKLKFLYTKFPILFLQFMSKLKLNKISNKILHKYISYDDQSVNDYVFSIYKQNFKI